MVRFPSDFPFNIGNYAVTQYRLGALMKSEGTRKRLLFHYFSLCSCFERKDDLT